MHSGSRTFARLCLIAVGILLVLPNATATTYAVSGSPYTPTNTLGSLDLWDSYELSAPNGAHVTYSVATSGAGCVMVLFVKGHSVSMSSTYYILYSQENCVASYSNTFPVGSNDGTDFTVLVATTSMSDVTYTVNIGVQPSSILDIALGLAVIVVIVAVVVVVLVVRRRRKAAKAPPMGPQPQMPPPGYPPQQPPQQPPLPPSPPGAPP